MSVILPALFTLGVATNPAPRHAGSARAPFVPTSPLPLSALSLSHAHVSNAPQSSLDWAGYAATSGTYDNVSGSWTQPTATCPVNKLEEAAFWVGIDGYNSTDPTVQQVGTDSDCTKGAKGRAGGPNYYAWYQMYPSTVVILPKATYPVAPGDSISASVSTSGTTYGLTISDGSKWHFSTDQTPTTTPENSSAEWIVEAPTSCNKSGSKCKILPLADFGSISFSAATANVQPASSSSGVKQIDMTTKNSKQTLAETSALSSEGNEFTVTWLNS